MFKRITSLLLAIVITVLGIPVCAADVVPTTQAASVEQILSDFHIKLHTAKTAANDNSRAASNSDNNKLLEDTVKTLTDAGYEAYSVTGTTFEAVEEALDTDLSAIGLDPNYSYIVVADGEPPNTSTRDALYGTPSPSFSYTYNGKTYTMRYLTVTAADDPAYGKTDDYDLLESDFDDFIVRCLDTSIQMTLDNIAAPVPLGTIAGLLGLSVGDIDTSSPMSLRLEGSANWTRVFTQVFDPSDDAWIYGACVEYVNSLLAMTGSYYKAATNRYTTFAKEIDVDTVYSDEYFDLDWRKEKGAYGAVNYWTQYDTAGAVRFRYGGDVVITLLENF